MKLSSVELVARIRQSRVLRDTKLTAYLDDNQLDPHTIDSRILAYSLVRDGLMTRFQLARIIKGRQHELVMGNIVLESMIGAGGMGTVYRARHRRMNRRVAIKIIDQSTHRYGTIMRRFQREVQAAAKLSHPNIVTAYDADEQGGKFFLVMEYVDGKDLATTIESDGPFVMPKAINCVIQAAKGLQYAHAQGIVHRDIKPGNLLLDASGTLKILDMGLARIDNTANTETYSDEVNLTGEHQIIGTVDYMSPEQADDSQLVDQRSDIYSLGCTLFFLLTGRSPFFRSTLINTLVAHRTDPIPSLLQQTPDLPPELDAVLHQMLAKDPRQRLSNMGEVIRQLTKFDDDTDFHLAESVGFSILDEDDSETRTFDQSDLLQPDSNQSDPVTLPPVGATEQGESSGAHISNVSANSATQTASDPGASSRHASPSGQPTAIDGPAIGIDLGTTFSVISHLDSEGRPTTLPNAEGDLLTPSVLLIEPDEVIVGKEAVKAMATDMPAIVECVKREIGSDSLPKRIRGCKFPPEVLLSWILKKLRDDAQLKLGPVRRAVITVPAYFDDAKRHATQVAGQLIGLEVLDIINEPTAAAIAYGYEIKQKLAQAGQTPDDKPVRYFVYDLGGGTFDVTLMETIGPHYRAIATDGDARLGGRDWDERIADWAAAEFMNRFGIDPRQDANAAGRLMRESEDVKRTLSSRKRASLAFEYQGESMRLEMTRDQLEEMTQDLLSRTEFTTRQTLEASGLQWSDIDHILVVGGATRMPAVVQMLHRISNIEPDQTLSPDESVAKGAALRAGALLSKAQGGEAPFAIQNVNSHSLGVVARSKKTGEQKIAVLIPRNSSLPAQASRTFRTGRKGQQRVNVQIVEGESQRVSECAQVGRCIVQGLPADLEPNTPVQVMFSYDESGCLEIDVRVGRIRLHQEITRHNELDGPEIDRWRQWLQNGELPVDEDQLIDLTDSDTRF